jgi:hypothetical protein
MCFLHQYRYTCEDRAKFPEAKDKVHLCDEAEEEGQRCADREIRWMNVPKPERCPECKYRDIGTWRNLKDSEKHYTLLRRPHDDEAGRDYFNSLSLEEVFRGDAIRAWLMWQRRWAMEWEEWRLVEHYEQFDQALCKKPNPDPEKCEPAPEESWKCYMLRVVRPPGGDDVTSFDHALTLYLQWMDRAWLDVGDYERDPKWMGPFEYPMKGKTPYPRGRK